MCVDGYAVVAASRDPKHGAGCQVWIANDIPMDVGGAKSTCIPPEAIQPVLIEPRMVAVEVASPTS
eukprot:15430594-Alexandrium_andersonii.AAC.1